jgi:hypothetical protein
MPEGAHPLPGWKDIGFVDLDGQSWSLAFAAKVLDVPERDLRKRVREEGLEPVGVIRMRTFRSQGRQPRAYSAEELIRIAETL